MSRKPLLLLGNSVSAETAACLQQSDLFHVLKTHTLKYQSDEPYTEIVINKKDNVNIKGAKAFVVQSTAKPVSDNIQHLLEIIHTLKSCGAAEVTAVIPYTALCRQDRHFNGRLNSVAADLLAKQLKAAGADKIISFSMHSQAASKFYQQAFGGNFIHKHTTDVFAKALKERYGEKSAHIIFGAPDGAEKQYDEGQNRARHLVHALTGSFNEKSMFGISKVHTARSDTKIISFQGDVANKDCVVIDDIVDGGSTMLNAAKILKERGAKSITCCLTHAILTGHGAGALDKMMGAMKDGSASPIDALIMLDSIPEAAKKVQNFARKHPELAHKISIVSLGPTILSEIKKHLVAGNSHPLEIKNSGF